MASLILLLSLIFFGCFNEITAGGKLIVVLIDGCRWDYIDNPNLDLKGFRKIAENGVRASAVYPVYPSLSYPNWYSIVTGLHAESHGFINNIMYDNETGTSFLMLPEKGSTDAYWWNVAEPVWITAEKQGKTSALYWWAGCEVEISGIQPMICERHRYGPGTEDEKIDFLERVDDVLEMFKPSRKDQLSLAMMYYGPVDYTGHYSGPKSSENLRALQDIDDILYKVLRKIEKADLRNEVNVMIVSDHGMIDVTEPGTKYISLEKFAPDIKFQVSAGATSMLVPEDGKLDKLYNDLKSAKINGIRVFKKEDLPESFHLKESPRVNEIFIYAEKGNFIKSLNDSKKRIGYASESYKGHHGFDPHKVKDMKTIFLATGPGFRRGYKLGEISNVDLYNVMCSVLQIAPLPNNGSSELVKEISGGEDTNYLKSTAVLLSLHTFAFLLPYIALVSILIDVSVIKFL